jgi:death on curing protein
MKKRARPTRRPRPSHPTRPPRQPVAPIWIDERDALAIHNRLLALDGGLTGVRDRGLLQSALARPQQPRAYGDNPDFAALAAASTAGIIRNHPFFDGNKRTGFVVGILFLEINGHNFAASEEASAHAVLSLAADTLNESQFAAWLRANLETSDERRVT